MNDNTDNKEVESTEVQTTNEQVPAVAGGQAGFSVKRKISLSTEYEAGHIPDNKRKGFLVMFVLMVTFTLFSASMWAGNTLGGGLQLSDFIWAIVIGGLILMTYTSLLAYIGSKTGFSMDLLARRSFGKFGSFLPSVMIGFTQIGWVGVGIGMLAIPVANYLDINHWWLIIGGGALMTATAFFGIRGLQVLSFISMPLIVILGSISMGMALNDFDGPFRNIFGGGEQITVMAGIGIVIGTFISGGTATPNFARFAKSARIAVICTAAAFFLGNTLMFMFGAVGGGVMGPDYNDIFNVMIAQNLALVAIVVLGLNIWTTNDSGLYSASLGMHNIANTTKDELYESGAIKQTQVVKQNVKPQETEEKGFTLLSKRNMVLVGGIIATLAAYWLYWNFVTWLGFLSATLPPIGIILILDYFIRKRNYAKDTNPTRTINHFAIAGVVVAALIANIPTIFEVEPFGIAPVNAMVVAALFYFIGLFVNFRVNNLKADGQAAEIGRTIVASVMLLAGAIFVAAFLVGFVIIHGFTSNITLVVTHIALIIGAIFICAAGTLFQGKEKDPLAQQEVLDK
ncbi:MAG: cytosine permease [Firmicutes bacterium]|nr:cytosine permease [Bacillota bacterium]